QAQPSLSEADKAAVITEFSKELQTRYVFPEIATKAVETLKSNLSAHRYDSTSDGPAFTKALNADLNDVCHDAHLHVSYSPEVQPVRKDIGKPSPIEIQRQHKMITQLNGGIEHAERLTGNIGYLEVRSFLADPKEASRPIQAAFDFLADTDALILDLRRNGGGDPATVQLLCSYLFDSKPVHLNDLYFREGNKTLQFWTQKSVPGHRFLNKPVYVLVSKRTGSGAEECAYDLQNTKRAKIVGQPTWGGANPGGFVRLDDHFSAFIPVGRAINPYTHANWEGTGVTPDVKADPAEALPTAEKLILKQLLADASDPDDKQRLQTALETVGSGTPDPGRK
ncbi:MAG TPA: S41 family peptidase, partial [Fimbriimonadaceae bacterium]|nr:S41 family peptidase [Fimbriimonadaceae bacterium]